MHRGSEGVEAATKGRPVRLASIRGRTGSRDDSRYRLRNSPPIGTGWSPRLVLISGPEMSRTISGTAD